MARDASATASIGAIDMAAPHAAGTVLVDTRAGRAVVVGGDRRTIVSIVDTRSDQLLHTVALGGLSFGGAIVATGTNRAFVLGRSPGNSGPSDTVSILDTRSGAVVRRVRISFAPIAATVDERAGRVFVASQGGLKANGTTPIGMGMVSALDARTGRLLWQSAVGLRPVAIAADAQTQRVFVVNAGVYGPTGPGVGSVSVLDARTGASVRTVTVNKAAVALAVDEQTNRVFVTHDTSQSVSMLDGRTGAVLAQRIPVGFATAIGIDVRARRVVVVDAAPGTVSLLDAASGAVVRTIAVGGDPLGVAIDTRTHHAIVTGTGTSLTSTLQHRFPLPFGNDDSGSGVSILDTRSGRVMHEVAVAPTRNVAVDEHTGQAFVSNWGANSVSVFDMAH